jgi:hypothetical protein
VTHPTTPTIKKQTEAIILFMIKHILQNGKMARWQDGKMARWQLPFNRFAI